MLKYPLILTIQGDYVHVDYDVLFKNLTAFNYNGSKVYDMVIDYQAELQKILDRYINKPMTQDTIHSLIHDLNAVTGVIKDKHVIFNNFCEAVKDDRIENNYHVYVGDF